MGRGIIRDDVTDNAGNAIQGKEVTIYIADTVTKATLYDASTGGSEIGNPVVTDEDGVFEAYADTGEYEVEIDGQIEGRYNAVDGDELADLLAIKDIGGLTTADKVTYDGESANVKLALDARVPTVATLGELPAALLTVPVGKAVDVLGRTTTGDGYQGRFFRSNTDYSAEVAVDTQQAIYIDLGDGTYGVRSFGQAVDSNPTAKIDWGVVDYSGATSSRSALNSLAALVNSVSVGEGTILIDSPLTAITKSFQLLCKGSKRTKIKYTGTGACFAFSEIFGMGAETDTTFSTNNGITLQGFTLYGDRGLAVTQHGMVFSDRIDQIDATDVFVEYMAGHGIALGFNAGGGGTVFVRESVFRSVHVRNCGTGSFAAMTLKSDGTGDSSNQINFYDLRVVFPTGPGFVIENANTAKPLSRVNIYGGELHGRLDGASTDLLRVIGNVTNLNTHGLKLNNAGASNYAVSIRSNATGSPAQCKFWLDHNVGANIFEIQAGKQIELHAGEFACTGTHLKIDSGVAPGANDQIIIDVPVDGSITTNIDASVADKIFSYASDNTAFPIQADKFIVDRTCSIVRSNTNPEGSVTALAGSLALKGSSGVAGDSDTLAVKVSGTGNTGWRYMQEIVFGTTANRPGTPTANQMYIDTTLGRPIWYIGGAWVFSDGTAA